MKTLEELGISPTPWRVLGWNGIFSQTCYTVESATHTVCDLNNDDNAMPDAQLIAGAPDMYKCLRDAVIETCNMCESCSGHPEYKCENKESKCFVKKWHAALERAGGAQ